MIPIILGILLIAILLFLKTGNSKMLLIISIYLMVQLILNKLVNLEDLIMFLNLIHQPILLIISQSIICYILYKLGFFRWVAYTIVFTAEKSEIKLLLHLLLFLMLLTIFTNVYAAMIIAVLLICDISVNIKLTEYKVVKFVLFSNLIIDISSIMSPSSSLNNLIYMKLFGIGYNSFIAKLFLPGFITLFILYIFIYVLNRKGLSSFTNNDIVNPDIFVKDWILLNLGFLAIFLNQASYFIVQGIEFPIYLIPLILSIVLFLYMFKQGKYFLELSGSKRYIFFIGTISLIYMIIYGLFINNNNFDLFGGLIGFKTDILKTSRTFIFLISASFASIFGEIPGAFLNGDYLETIKNSLMNSHSLIYISIIGNVIGGKVLFYGSLNNIISKRMLIEKGLSFTFGEYLKIVLPLLILCSIIFILTALLII